VFAEANTISDILASDVSMSPLTDVEQAEFERATCCRNCKADFSSQNPRMRHHSHGMLQLQSGVEAEEASSGRGGDDDDYLVPIVFHNMTAYGGHFVLQFFRKEYTEYKTKFGKTAYADVGAIPMNGERNLQLSIGNVVVIDSMQFIAASLDNLVKEMRTPDWTISRTRRGISGGTSCSSYMIDVTKFDEIALPPKSAFYSR